MPPITILKSELIALEQKIKAQQVIIKAQEKMIKLMRNALVDAGLLEKDPKPAECE